ncbi:hypothetical protein ACFQZC_03110 [Streptacidiphilus monticola]
MGLSDGENDILQHLMPDARRLARQQGPDAVQSAVRRAAERPCRAYAASLPSSPTGPSNGWPQ